MKNVIQRHWFTTVRFDPPTPCGDTILNHADTEVSTEQLQTTWQPDRINNARVAELDTGNRQSTGQLNAQTMYCGTDREVGTRLRVDLVSFKILEATLENHSPPVTIMDIPQIRGIEAYLKSGPAIRDALAHLDYFPRELFAETIRGIIQAETFLYKERGFASASEYNEHWNKTFANSCRYYSNLDRITQKWVDYADYMRTGNLFNRFKTQSVYAINDKGGYFIVATFCDSFHELSIEIETDNSLVITKANSTLLRAPDNVCREATVFLQQLPGHGTASLDKKKIAALLGKGDGCVHIIDTVYDALTSVIMANQRRSRPAT